MKGISFTRLNTFLKKHYPGQRFAVRGTPVDVKITWEGSPTIEELDGMLATYGFMNSAVKVSFYNGEKSMESLTWYRKK